MSVDVFFDRKLMFWIQLLISFFLLYWLVVQVDWREIAFSLTQADFKILVIGVFVYYTGIILSCCKWRLLLDLEQISLNWMMLGRWYLIGAFANNFLPSDIGGDLGRGYLAGRASGQPVAVARSIIVERATGLGFMLILAWFGLLVLLPHPQLTLMITGMGLALLGLLGMIVVYARHRGIATRWLTWLQIRMPAKLNAVYASSVQVWYRAQLQPGTWGGVLLISLGFQLLAGCGLWLNLRAVAVELPLFSVILAAALAGVVGLIPISVNGWGMREGILIALLTPLGAPASGVLAGSLLARFLTMVLSLPGGLLFLTEPLPQPAASEPETPSGRECP